MIDFVHGSLDIPNCAMKSQMHRINTVQLIVFKGPWMNETVCTVALLATIFRLKTQSCVDQSLRSVCFSITVEIANVC